MKHVFMSVECGSCDFVIKLNELLMIESKMANKLKWKNIGALFKYCYNTLSMYFAQHCNVVLSH